MDLEQAKRVAQREGFLAVVCTARPDGSLQASVVNAGFLPHPLTGVPAVGIVAAGGSVKLGNLRLNPRVTVVFRSGFEWVAVEGRATLIGPDDHLAAFPPARVPQLLRDVFRGAGGSHDDWPTYDRVMADERRTAVLVEPLRIYSNRG